jgi:alkylhydroperoxidase family enzyme
MPRLGEVSRKAAANNPYVQLIYQRKFGDRDFVTAPGTKSGAPGNWETVVAQSTDCLEHAVRGMALWSSPNRLLPPLLRELAVTRTGWACGCQFVFSQHCKVLRSVGGTDEQVASIPGWEVSDLFTPIQRAVLAYTDCLAGSHGRTPEAVMEALKGELPEEAIVELTYIVCMYIGFATTSRALRLEFDDKDDPVSEVPLPEGTPSWAWAPMTIQEGNKERI